MRVAEGVRVQGGNDQQCRLGLGSNSPSVECIERRKTGGKGVGQSEEADQALKLVKREHDQSKPCPGQLIKMTTRMTLHLDRAFNLLLSRLDVSSSRLTVTSRAFAFDSVVGCGRACRRTAWIRPSFFCTCPALPALLLPFVGHHTGS